MQYFICVLIFSLLTSGYVVLADSTTNNPTALTETDEAVATTSVFDLKTEKVMVVQDNYALFHKTSTGTTDEQGQAYTDDIPEQMIIGTFWAHSKRGKLQQVTLKWHEQEEKLVQTATAASVLEILLANQGQFGQLRLKDGSRYQGLFLKTLLYGDTITTPTASNEMMHFPHKTFTEGAANQPLKPLKPNTTGTHFILRTLENDVLLPIEAVHSIKINDMKTEVLREITQSARHQRMVFQFATPKRSVEVEMAYFRTGINWMPSYQLNLNPKHVTLTLKATVVNNAEDLINVPLELVTGATEFRYREQFSPMRLTAPDTSVAQMPQRLYDAGTRTETIDTAYDMLTGDADQQDRFIYRIPARTLLNGEKAVFPLMRARIPFKHVYIWNVRMIHPKLSDLRADRRGRLPLRTSINEIWHKLELTNETKQPWTAGSVLIESHGQMFSQDTLEHTPPGQSVRIPLSRTTELKTQLSQREIQRQVKDYKVGNNQYTRLDRQLVVSVINDKETDVLVEINLLFGGMMDRKPRDGDMMQTTLDPADWEQYEGDPSANKHTLVRWRTPIAAKQRFRRVISYYVRILD